MTNGLYRTQYWHDVIQSHLAGNAASQHLARSLGAAWYARWAEYTA